MTAPCCRASSPISRAMYFSWSTPSCDITRKGFQASRQSVSCRKQRQHASLRTSCASRLQQPNLLVNVGTLLLHLPLSLPEQGLPAALAILVDAGVRHRPNHAAVSAEASWDDQYR